MRTRVARKKKRKKRKADVGEQEIKVRHFKAIC